MTTTNNIPVVETAASTRRTRGLCASCRCSSIGDRVCRRGEMGDGPHGMPGPLMSTGLEPVPLVLDPPHRVAEALTPFAASLAAHGDL